MKQFKLTFMLTLFMSMVGANAFSTVSFQLPNDDGVMIYYRLNDQETEASVTNPSSYPFETYSGDIKIPESVTYLGKTFPVTSISAGAFSMGPYSTISITSIRIPKSITKIGDESGGAILGCLDLASIIVESGNSVFDSRNNCNAIIETSTNTLVVGCKNTIIPNSVTSIGNYAFDGCSSLTSITIPNGVTSIGTKAFNSCSFISISFPNSMTSIGDQAFENCKGLTSISFPSSVTYIGISAFNNCTNLTSIDLPSSVTSVGIYAFDGTAWFDNQPIGLVYIGKVLYKYKGDMLSNTSVVVDDGTVGIAGGAFSMCSGLTSITLPSSLKCIEGAFGYCEHLTSISLPNGMKKIGSGAFQGCNSLTSVTIPSSVESIGSYAFGDCNPQLKLHITDLSAWCNIQFESNYMENSCYMYYWPDINMGMSQGNQATLCLNGTDIKDLVIPTGVTSIPAYAFYGLNTITSLTIPNSVTSIGRFSFACPNLEKIESLIVNPYDIAEDDYGNNSPFSFDLFNKTTLYVPSGSKSKYQAKKGWNKFDNIVEGTGGGGTPSPSGSKCAMPVISFVDGKLSFSCATDGVAFMYTISNDDVKSGDGNDIMLGMKYHVSVYATKDGLDNSEAATMDITIDSSGKAVVVGDMDGNGVLNATDVVKLVDKIMGR